VSKFVESQGKGVGGLSDIATVVQREVELFARGDWAKARGFAVSDTNRKIYTVIGVADYPRKFPLLC